MIAAFAMERKKDARKKTCLFMEHKDKKEHLTRSGQMFFLYVLSFVYPLLWVIDWQIA